MILAGDIGATNTRLALFEAGKKMAEARFLSQNFPSLSRVVQTFFQQHKTNTLSCAVFGVAGPVQNGQCHTTNLPWFVDHRELEKELNIKTVFLLNDLEACAWGIRILPSQDLLVLHAGDSRAGNQALIVAGTGLGEAGLYWDGKKHCPFACEGGHTDFGPRDELETELLQRLRKIYGHVSYERIISGSGLFQLYQMIISKYEKPSKEVQQKMTLKDPAAVISEWQNRDPACRRAIDWFLSLYGAEAGNLALKIMALGGLYVGGKIAKVLANNMKEGGFVRAFQDKGRFSNLLKTIPVRLILNEDAPLLGASEYARSQNASFQ